VDELLFVGFLSTDLPRVQVTLAISGDFRSTGSQHSVANPKNDKRHPRSFKNGHKGLAALAP
jgi:hypothetical protein